MPRTSRKSCADCGREEEEEEEDGRMERVQMGRGGWVGEVG